MVGDVLLSEDRGSRGHLADDRDLDDLAARQVGHRVHLGALGKARTERRTAVLAAVDDAQGPALQFAAEEIPLPLERLEVIVHAICRSDPEVLTDLADGGRVSLLEDRPLDEGEDFFLTLRERLGHRATSTRATVLNGRTLVKFSGERQRARLPTTLSREADRAASRRDRR